MVKFAAWINSYANPIGFSIVLIVVPLETLVQDEQGGAKTNKERGPGKPLFGTLGRMIWLKQVPYTVLKTSPTIGPVLAAETYLM